MQGYAWAEDKEHCEEYGRLLQADPSKVSQRAKKRGLPEVHAWTLHAAEPSQVYWLCKTTNVQAVWKLNRVLHV